MDDKTFFEELAKGQDGELVSEPQEMKIELAKAGGSVISREKKTVKKTLAEEFEEEAEGQLTIDVFQTPDEIVVESAVAGVDPDDIDINISNDSITIKGKRHREHTAKEEDYFYRECYWGRFSRSVILPQEIDPEKAYANFKNGILSVHLPKLTRQKTKKVKVRLE